MENLRLHKENGIATITINRENKLNALNFQTLDELRTIVIKLLKDDQIACIILTGTGPKAFVAGADISEIHYLNKDEAEKIVSQVHDTFNLIENSPKPVIAAVNGYALGGGCELAMACHIRIASNNAQFAQPEINLGIIPGYGGTQRLTQLVGKGKALELMLTGDYISAQEAHTLGLVNEVVNQENLLIHCYELAKKLSSKPAVATKLIIDAVNSHFKYNQDGFDTEIKNFGKCCDSEDFKEGTQAFLEKRKANFRNE